MLLFYLYFINLHFNLLNFVNLIIPHLYHTLPFKSTLYSSIFLISYLFYFQLVYLTLFTLILLLYFRQKKTLELTSVLRLYSIIYHSDMMLEHHVKIVNLQLRHFLGMMRYMVLNHQMFCV